MQAQTTTENDSVILKGFLAQIENGNYLPVKDQVFLLKKQLEVTTVLLSKIDSLINVHDSLISSSVFKNALENNSELAKCIMTNVNQEIIIRFLKERNCDCKRLRNFQRRTSMGMEVISIADEVPTEQINQMRSNKKYLEEAISFLNFGIEYDPQLETQYQKSAIEKILIMQETLPYAQELLEILSEKYNRMKHIEKGLKEEKEEMEQNRIIIKNLRQKCKCR